MKRESIIITAVLILTIFILSAFGQNSDNKNGADNVLRGSGRINSSTLGMEIDIPLGSYPGRGINVPISLSYSSKVWRMEFTGNFPIPAGNSSSCYANYRALWSEESASGWSSSLAVPYVEYTGAENLYNADGTPISYDEITCPTSDPPSGSYPVHYVRRLVVHLPSGETHELRANDTILNYAVGNGINPSDWNTTFYAVDGSNIKFIQDSTNSSYRLLMPDGSFYDFETFSGLSDRKANKFTDRNGNYTTYHNDDTINYPNGYWKDTLGKNIPIPIKPQAPGSPTTASSPQIYSMPGITTGTPVTYKLQWKLLKGSSATESGLTNFNLNLKPIGDVYGCLNGNGHPTTCVLSAGNSLFGGGGSSTGPRVIGETIFNPIVLTEIELPTGLKYKFSYDIYGRIEKITYPTGGKEVFEYSVVPTLSVLNYDDLTGQANFGVTDRKVYPDSGQSANYNWTYDADYVSNPSGYLVTTINPDGTKSERTLHRGIDAGSSSGFGYDNGLAGMAYDEKAYDNSNPRKLLSKQLTTWTKSALTTGGGSVTAQADWHPRATQAESLVYDGTSGVSTTSKFYYYGDLSYRDAPVLQNKVEQFAYVTAGSSLPSNPVRTTETTYLIGDSNYDSVKSYYVNQNMIGLATASIVRDSGGTIVSRSETAYDENGTYPILTYGSNPSQWQAPTTGYRGNPTTSKVWDSTKGAFTNAGAYVATHAQFDSFGNQRKVWDAKGTLSQTEFSSTYGYAFPTKSISGVPDPNPTQNFDGLAHGSQTTFETTATFDPTTGLPLTTTDTNGLETRIAYHAETLRPLNTKTYYQGNQIGSTSEIVYHDETNNYWLKNRSQIDTDKWTESITYFDGLARPYKSEQVDSQGNIFVEKEFDDKGRVKRVTDPFRSGETKQWTTNVYDEASRIKEVTMPDGAKVVTDYGVSTSGIIGVTKQITDQASKKRKGISDALGRMVRVIEDPTGTPLETNYVFDTLGNIRKTTQGEQNRYFTYDSLGRLLYAKQVEQDTNGSFSYTDSITGNTAWSVKYEYDDNGNIIKTTNAAGVYVQGSFDKFNRLIYKNYSDTTPDAVYFYDGTGLGSTPAFSKGRTTKAANSVSETRYTGFDIFGRVLTSEQRTPFGTESAEQATPRVSTYQYDAYGKFISETYPSGRTVQMNYNTDGEVSGIWGTVGTNNRLYANGFSYNSSGAMERMRLGNGKWEAYTYNNRLQITEIGLGHSATDKSLLKLEYGYGSPTENNGSLRSQKISFSGLTHPFEQSYYYDSLNRLQSAEEKVNSQTTWKQTFSIDRYGNRRFDAANTTTLGSCSTAICNPTINTSNNRFSSGQGYSYSADGNLNVDAEGKQFFYDAENHQKEVKNSSNETIGLYLYDAEGKRVKKISLVETVIFVYNANSQLVAEYSTQLAPTPQLSFLTSDHLSSPRVITNQNGVVTTRKDYAAFGEETFTAQRTSGLKYDQSETRKGYTGYEKDAESGLDFAQARYYNSTHGRFTSIDPLIASANIKNPQTFNRYSYVQNSPYKLVDPLGLISSSTGAYGTADDCPASYSGCYDVIDDGGFAVPDPAHEDRHTNEATEPPTASASAAHPETSAPMPPPKPIAQQNADTPPQPDNTEQQESDRRAQMVAQSLMNNISFTAIFGEREPFTATPFVNCVAWGLDIFNRWIQPESVDSETGRKIFGRGDILEKEYASSNTFMTKIRGDFTTSGKIQGTTAIALAYGGVEYTGGWIPPGYHVMRVFENPDDLTATHVMRREADGTWTSKNGSASLFKGITNPNAFARYYYPTASKGKITDFLVPNRR